MSDRFAIQWGLPFVIFITGITLAVAGVLFPHTKDRIVYRYVTHPKGVIERPKYAEDSEIGGGTSKVCTTYSNFDPDKATGRVVGQRFISDCSIVKTAPKG